MSDQIIQEEKWSYVLFSRNNDWFLTFLAGGVVELDATVRLLPDEIQRIQAGTLSASVLVERFKKDTSLTSDRRLNQPVWPQ
jgi:hypothetical protein